MFVQYVQHFLHLWVILHPFYMYIPTKINDKFTNFTHLTFTMWHVFWQFHLCDCDLITYSFLHQINLSKEIAICLIDWRHFVFVCLKITKGTNVSTCWCPQFVISPNFWQNHSNFNTQLQSKLISIINLPYDKSQDKFLVAICIWMQEEDIGICSYCNGHCLSWHFGKFNFELQYLPYL